MERKLSILGLLILLIAIPIGVVASLSQQIFTPHAATLPCATAITFVQGQFLKANGTGLFYNGQRICLYGATIYTSSGPGAPSGSWTSSSFTKRIDWDLQMAQAAHLNFIRVTDYANSANSDMYDPTLWQNMDYLLTQTQSKGIFVLMDLSSYAQHLQAGNINPYDSSQDSGWQKFIAFVANRYKNIPNIAYYSIKGEVNPVGASFPTSTTQGYLDFYTRTTNGVFASDSNHLIEAGGLTHLNQSNSGIPWQQIFGLPHVGLASIHVYSANRLDPINGSNDLNQTLPAVAAWAKQNNKPLDVQEYGLVNQLGDSQRASAMQTIIQRAIDNGVAAIVYWNLGPETTPGQHYDVNPNFPLAWQQFVNGASLFYGSSTYFPGSTAILPYATVTPTPSVTPTPTPLPKILSYKPTSPTPTPKPTAILTPVPSSTPTPTILPTIVLTDTPVVTNIPTSTMPTDTPAPTSNQLNTIAALITSIPTFAPTSVITPTPQPNAPTPTPLVAGSKTVAAFGATFFLILLIIVLLLVIPTTRRKILLLLVKTSFYEKNPLQKQETKDTSAIQAIEHVDLLRK